MLHADANDAVVGLVSLVTELRTVCLSSPVLLLLSILILTMSKVQKQWHTGVTGTSMTHVQF